MPQLSDWTARLKQWVKQERQVLLVSGGVALMVIFLRFIGLFQSWELAAFDSLFRLRPSSEIDPRITIVEIGEGDIQQAGKWPIPDRVMAELLEKVKAAGPRVIGLDVYRDLPVEPGHKDLQAAFRSIDTLIGIEQLEDRDSVGVFPPPILQEKGQIGFNNVVTDADGRVRRGLLYWHQQGQPHISFALKLALIYLKAEGIRPRSAENSQNLQLGKAVFRPFEGMDGGYVWADAKGYQFIGNFYAPDRFERVSMGDILADKVPPRLIRDRIVLIGSTAPSLKDYAYIPHSTNLLGNVEPIYGVELHANFVRQLLEAAFGKRHLIRPIPEPLEWLWILGWSGMGALATGQGKSPLRSGLGLGIALMVLFGSVYLNFLRGWWLPSVPPLVGSIGSFTILTSYLAYQQEELKRSKEFLQSVIDTIADPIFVKDTHHRWVVLNQAFCQFSGYSLERLLGKSDGDILPFHEAELFWQQDRWVFTTGQAQENEETFTNAEGKTYEIATKRSLHKDAAGNLFLVGVIRDITERKRIEEELRRTTVELSRSNEQLKLSRDRLHRLAYYDSLTGLANRKLFYESLHRALEWAERNHRVVGLLYLDLDGFKQVNDTLGHAFGDLLLKAAAGRIMNCVRGSDLVARLGGDEFTIILPGIREMEDVAIVAGKILKTLSQPFMLQGHTIAVTASIGSSLYPHDAQTQDVLIEKADMAMFCAKRLGRNQHQLS